MRELVIVIGEPTPKGVARVHCVTDEGVLDLGIFGFDDLATEPAT